MRWWRRKKRYKDITPEEIFLDAQNRAGFDTSQFEGRLEQPIRGGVAMAVIGVFILVVLMFGSKLWTLQITRGEAYFEQSENNRLDTNVLFAKRGPIVDRRGVELVSNIVPSEPTEFPRREYATTTGLAHVLGYVTYPQKDTSGFYFQTEIEGKDGVELIYNNLLEGENGSKITETDALGKILSESLIKPPEDGETLQLSIDARIQERLYTSLESLAERVGFKGGASIILDIHTGEVLAVVSFPEYDPHILTEGDDNKAIQSFVTSTSNPFLNRAISGLYTPGSIIKPYVAVGALEEGVIDPTKEILSTGELVVPNPYDPAHPTIFKDWKAHGWVDIRHALAVSSNVYFFNVGGGFEDQQGIGIAGIEHFVKLFGIGDVTDIDLPGEVAGIVPSPKWKREHFGDDPWRVGDTYNTSIGQYGFQVTPVQMARAVAAIANGGLLVEPHVRIDEKAGPTKKIDVDETTLQIVREGMRQAVLEGTSQGLNIPSVAIAAKSGTAELGSTKQDVNSWLTGFFPYENPRYAFATVMERGPATNLVGSLFVMRELFDWMSVNAPEYLE